MTKRTIAVGLAAVTLGSGIVAVFTIGDRVSRDVIPAADRGGGAQPSRERFRISTRNRKQAPAALRPTQTSAPRHVKRQTAGIQRRADDKRSEHTDVSLQLLEILAITDDAKRRIRLEQLAVRVVDTFPDRIPELLDEVRFPGDGGIFLNALCRALAVSDPEAAAALINAVAVDREMSDYRDLVDGIAAIAESWVRLDPYAAAEWLWDIPDERVRDKTLTGVAHVLVNKDPLMAAEWVETLPAGGLREKSLLKVAFQWSQKDIVSAAYWVSKLPDDTSKIRAVYGLVNIWTREDPHAAAHWAIALPNPSTRDAAVSHIIDSWTYSDPGTVADWVASFEPGMLQTQSFHRVFSTWLQFDRPSAEAWLIEAGAPLLEQVGFRVIDDPAREPPSPDM